MRARVENGRWVLEDPTGLPDGTVVEIVTRPVATAPADVYFDDRLRMWVRALLAAACSPRFSAGRGFAGPNEEQEIVDAAKACALAAGQAFVLPQDVKEVATAVLRRFVAVRGADMLPDDVVRKIYDETPLP